jgi:dTDP-4-amino-4,6-dideoxygalactose transaminase
MSRKPAMMPSHDPIYVTRPFLPPKEAAMRMIDRVYETQQLTNQGPLLQELETALEGFLNIPKLHFLGNGTIALQLAMKVLGVDHGEVITTPFSYVATTSSLLWERCTPVFADIHPKSLAIDPATIEALITPNTTAIMATHVYGYPCDVDALADIATRHGLKLIYDGAHAFGVTVNGKSIFSYGDATTCSFHATKLFNTVEGGSVVLNDASLDDRLELVKRFGHQYDDHHCLGINGKNSELHAGMGLAGLPYVQENIAKRKIICDAYDALLKGIVERPIPVGSSFNYNYAYYPVIFKDEARLLKVFTALNLNNIFPRRYFYPSLNTLPYLKTTNACPVSEEVSMRVACLPLYPDLALNDVECIATIIRRTLAVTPTVVEAV